MTLAPIPLAEKRKIEQREKTAFKVFARNEATTLTKANSEKH